jgi:hypothetical protein
VDADNIVFNCHVPHTIRIIDTDPTTCRYYHFLSDDAVIFYSVVDRDIPVIFR